MKYELIAHTDKAEVYRLSDGSVLKRYLTRNAPERVKHDTHALTYIENHFGEVQFEGWTYRTVRILRVAKTGRAIYMEDVPGKALSDLPRSEMNLAEYHCGIWIALYHQNMLSHQRKGFIFTDYIPHNIIVDMKGRSVTAIDPGMLWGEQGNMYEDLLLHIQSGLTTLVARNKASPLIFRHFLRGYLQVGASKFDLQSYLEGVYREIRSRARHYLRISTFKFIEFAIVTTLLLPLYLIVIPAYFVLHERSANKTTLCQ